MDGNNLENTVESTAETLTESAEAAQANEKKSSLGVISLIFAIAGLALDPCCGTGFVFGVVALILGALGKSKNPEDKKANVGFILGFVAIGLAVFVAIIENVIYAANVPPQ